MAKLLNITGGEALAKALRELPVKIEKNILRSAMRAGARVIANEAKGNVPVEDGDLKRSIRVSTNTRKGEVTAKAVAGGKKVYYAHFVEFGTVGHIISAKSGSVLRFTTRDGKYHERTSVNHPGARAKPFLRPALDSKAQQAVRAVAKQIAAKLTERGIDTPDLGSDD